MTEPRDQSIRKMLSAFSIIRKTYAKPAAHELVNITPSQFLAMTQDERSALYLIGLAVNKPSLDSIFAYSDADWAIINLRSGRVVMYGSAEHRPGEADIERLLLMLSEVCFLYERSLWQMLGRPQTFFDA